MASSSLMLSTLWLLLSLSSIHADNDYGLCCLCDGCGPMVAGRDSQYVTPQQTCADVYLEMADTSNDSQYKNDACEKMIDQYRKPCCDPSYSLTPFTPEIQPNKQKCEGSAPFAQGPEPPCDICSNKKCPGLPNTVTALLYVEGNPTCLDLYWMGLTGNLLDRLCKPAQDYFFEPCGCDL